MPRLTNQCQRNSVFRLTPYEQMLVNLMSEGMPPKAVGVLFGSATIAASARIARAKQCGIAQMAPDTRRPPIDHHSLRRARQSPGRRR